MALDRLFGQIFEIARALTSSEPARPSAPPPPRPEAEPVAAIPRAPAPMVAAPEFDDEDESDGLAGEDEIVAVRASDRDLLLSWQIGDDCIRRGKLLLPDAGEIAVKLVYVHRAEGSDVRSEERERVVERMGEWLVADVPKDAWITASVGLRQGGRFVSLAHSPAARAG